VSKAKKYIRIVRRTVWYSIAAIVIIMAVLVSMVRLFLPDVTGYRTEVEQIASAFMDHTVRIESMDARLVGFTPTLIFNDVHMLDKTGKRELVRFKQARLGISLFESMSERRVVPRDFTIEGIQLALTRRKDGRFLVQGIDLQKLEKTFKPEASKGTGELANWLFKRSHLALQKSTILWKDLKRGGNTLRFDDVSVDLKNEGDRHQLNGYVKLPEQMGKQFEIAMDVTGNILNPYEMQGKIYMRGDALNLDKWGVKPQYQDFVLHTGTADFQVWGTWKNNAVQQISGDLSAYNLNVSLPVLDKPLRLKLLGGMFSAAYNENGWRVNVDRFHYMSPNKVWPETRFSIHHQTASGKRPESWDVRTEHFRLEDVAELLQRTNLLDDKQRKLLETMKPAGDIRSLYFHRETDNNKQPVYQVQADFANLSSKPWRSVPGVSGLHGEFWSDMSKGRLKLESKSASMDFPRLFRWPLKMNRLQGEIQWARNKDGIRIRTQDFKAKNDDVELAANVLLDVPMQKGVSPYLDMQAQFKNGDAEFVERYYPTGIMKTKLVHWLDRSIRTGHVRQGGIVYNGRVKDFPFRSNQGQFKVEFDAEDVELDYHEGWPRVTQVNMDAVFTSLGMDIRIKRANIFDSEITDSRATIPKFKLPVLHLQGDVSGSLKDVARFLVESPAAPGGKNFVQQARIEGPAHTRFEAEIPLNKRAQQQSPIRYQGQVNINKGAMYLLQDRLDITGLQGEVEFDQEGVTSRNLVGKVLDEDTTFEIMTQPEADNRRISILANGQLDAGNVARRFELPGAQAVSGKSSWHGAVVLNTGKGQTQPPLVRVVSNLDQVKIDLPPPLDKLPDEERNLVLQEVLTGEKRSTLSVNYADKVNLMLELQHGESGDSLNRGYVYFGPDQGQLPDDQVLQISGALDSLQLSDWVQAFYDGKSGGKKESRFQLPIRIAMDHVGLARPAEEEGQAPEQKPDKFPPPPQGIPQISGYITHLQYGEHPLGKAEFEITDLKKGLHLQRLALQGDNIRLNASGDWLYKRRKHLTDINFELSSPDMGKLLQSFGYSAIIAGGNMVARGAIEWQAPPSQFDLASLKGTMDLSVKKGSITRVKPGAGRLLGLFSLSALPRRLMLDFRDTFQEGLSFDQMQGQMKFRDGSAYTDALDIDSPAAKIRVQGRTGLVDEDFDQYVTVVPQVGDTLPVAGGLLFGTQVGAVILFFEKLLGGQIDTASAQRYHITGSWEDPKIESLGEKQAKVPSEKPAN